ncbi:porin [Rhodoferax sp. 4810]|uniref:Porin n=1 Tax=Thiospirillum jenense TaxID=1653858 RepID=A0A839HMK8_9GAMM|nr:porin [Thiospirillum jenense]MBB1075093.1 porin [Rhodoferax jenense]MBB1126742.1 porin [Thiospirillum jenense]
MNKQLIGAAIAAAVAVPSAAMAEAILYGKLNVSLDYAEVTNAVALPQFDANGNQISDGEDFTGWGVNGDGGFMPGGNRDNRFGVKGSEDLGNGLKAIYQFEVILNLSAADNNFVSSTSGNDNFIVRTSFAGLAGSFGTVLMGRHDTPMKVSTGPLDLFDETVADYAYSVGFEDLRVDNAVAYISPSFSGFQFMGALVAPGGATTGFGANANSDEIGAYSLAAIYKNGPFYGSLAYESISNESYMNTQVSDAGELNPAYIDDDYNKWRASFGILDWNGFTFAAIYEGRENNLDNNTNYIQDMALWQIQAGYAFGNNMVKAMYGAVDRDIDFDNSNTIEEFDADRNTWAVAFDHNLSKRTKAYVLYSSVEDDNVDIVRGAEWSNFSIGMMHKF